MKLTELNPRWVGNGGEGVSDAQGNPVPRRDGIGIVLTCPCGTNCQRDLFVPFTPGLDGEPYEKGGHVWNRASGDSFENLTLTPSILRMDGCKWHGYITNGEIINC